MQWSIKSEQNGAHKTNISNLYKDQKDSVVNSYSYETINVTASKDSQS